MANPSSQDDASLKGTILYKMGKAHAALQHHSEAIDCFQQAYEIIKDAARPVELVVVLEYFEVTYRKSEQENKAVEVRRNIETILTEAAKSTDSHIVRELASYYIDRERLREAQAILDRADTLFETYSFTN